MRVRLTVADDGAGVGGATIPSAVVVVDLADQASFDALPGVPAPTGAGRAVVLVRDGCETVGMVDVPVRSGRVRAHDVVRAVERELLGRLVTLRIRRELERPVPAGGIPTGRLGGAAIVASPSGDAERPAPASVPACLPPPSLSAVICTRDRPAELAGALEALVAQAELHEIVVVDNAPSSDATARVVEHFTERPAAPASNQVTVRYVCEPVPGLDRARTRGAAAAAGEVVAFTDDDARVHPGWAAALLRVFSASADVWAVAGLVVPAVLDTEAQVLFERQGGFGRGHERRWYHRDLTDPDDLAGRFLGAGRFGTGANMAFRRSELLRIGGFDPALDVGTPSGGGGDLNAMFEVLHHGGVLVYEPAAVVAHRHRPTLDELRRQIAGNGGMVAHLSSSVGADQRLLPDALRLGRWYVGWFARRLARSAAIPGELPADHVLAEIRSHVGAATGRSLRAGRAEWGEPPFTRPTVARGGPPVAGEAVVCIDLADELPPAIPTHGFARTRVHVSVAGAHIGRVAVGTGGRDLPRAQLLDEIAAHIASALVADAGPTAEGAVAGAVPAQPAELVDRVGDHRCRTDRVASEAVRASLPSVGAEPERLAASVVSVVIATLDRPDDLRACLETVTRQQTRHHVEVIVVDNDPAAAVVAPVLRSFPGVRLVEEPRRGLSYARNAGVRAATGSIIATTDDDVLVPPGWIERLVAPFVRDDVMAVCGNVLPAELGTPSQIAFEDLRMLGKGDVAREIGPREFAASLMRAVPTWELGATANAAFRRAVFDDPAMGWFDTALGAGTPSGCSEDSYLIYRIVRAGHTALYEPSCWVSHRHRRTDDALRGQLRAYYRGAVAHQLATVRHDRDLRGALHIGRIVAHESRRTLVSLLRRRPDAGLRAVQLRGVIEGPWAYRRSVRLQRRTADPASPAPGSAAQSGRPSPVRAPSARLPSPPQMSGSPPGGSDPVDQFDETCQRCGGATVPLRSVPSTRSGAACHQ